MIATPNPEQQAAIDCDGNAVITARPGSGKTFTLSRIIKREDSKLLSYQGVIAISYTHKASDELMERCKGLGLRSRLTFFGTIDSFCLGEIVAPFARFLTNCRKDISIVDDDKYDKLKSIKSLERDSQEFCKAIADMISLGSIPISLLGEAALLVLNGVKEAREYLRARYTCICIDEYQDCGITQHLIFLKLVSFGLRGVVVGDIDQAIYRFAGKTPAFLVELLSTEGFTHFEITENHRCDKGIILYSLALMGKSVRGIPADQRRVFAVHVDGDEDSIASAIARVLNPICMKYNIADARDTAIIGSSNATLIRVSKALGIPFKLFGQTPMDKGVSPWHRIITELLNLYYSQTVFTGEFVDRHLGISARRASRNTLSNLISAFRQLPESGLADSTELIDDILEICAPDGGSQDDLARYHDTVCNLELLHNGFRPARPGEVNILTYHKAKGLEFDVVFCLETYEYVMPPYHYEDRGFDAKSEALAKHYVGITRARKAAYIILGSQRHNANNQLRDAVPSQFLDIPGVCSLRNETHW